MDIFVDLNKLSADEAGELLLSVCLTEASALSGDWEVGERLTFKYEDKVVRTLLHGCYAIHGDYVDSYNRYVNKDLGWEVITWDGGDGTVVFRHLKTGSMIANLCSKYMNSWEFIDEEHWIRKVEDTASYYLEVGR